MELLATLAPNVIVTRQVRRSSNRILCAMEAA